EHVPFADHNAMQDPSCPDITGRVLECLSWHDLDRSNPSIERAIRYIKGHQRFDGWFFGRWGVNGIYGTWQAVIGPIRCGEPRSSAWIQRAGAWIRSTMAPSARPRTPTRTSRSSAADPRPRLRPRGRR
ncbi:MAG: hypothetical protein O2927_03200, partial [Planctomycetota bacterium]|nr:hypothetical protein [Planctomycetota bacterium]